MPKQNNYSKHAEDSLIKAMMTVLEQKDFQNITIGDICAEASVSRTTFYLYFEDKYNLVVNCFKRYVVDILDDQSIENIEDLYDQLLTFNYEKRKVMKNLIRFEGTKELEHKMDKIFLDGFIKFYKRQMLDNQYPDIPLEVIAIYNCCGFNGLLKWWITSDFAIPKGKMIQYLKKINVFTPYENILNK